MKEIHIVFDGPPAPQSGRFVEVENEKGESISMGDWIEYPNGLWHLVISKTEIVQRLTRYLNPRGNNWKLKLDNPNHPGRLIKEIHEKLLDAVDENGKPIFNKEEISFTINTLHWNYETHSELLHLHQDKE